MKSSGTLSILFASLTVLSLSSACGGSGETSASGGTGGATGGAGGATGGSAGSATGGSAGSATGGTGGATGGTGGATGGTGGATGGTGGTGGAPDGVCASGDAPNTYFLSPNGDDGNSGAASKPWATFAHGLDALKAGDTLCVHGGDYTERVQASGLNAGTAASPVRVYAVPGEKPVVKGLFWIKGASYWHFRGINVTWGPNNSHDEHMVKLTDGEGWEVTDAEIWGAQSFAAILIAGAPSGWALRRLYVHDTADLDVTGHSVNQDHLIYANAGTGGGTIERCVLVGSPNGRGVKIGPPSCGAGATANVVIRYNTMVDNLGPSNIQFSCESHDNLAEHNILVHPQSGRTNITAFSLTGAKNTGKDNIGWDSDGVVETGTGLVDGGGNQMLDPKFVNPAAGDYHPMDATASMYGAYAP